MNLIEWIANDRHNGPDQGAFARGRYFNLPVAFDSSKRTSKTPES